MAVRLPSWGGSRSGHGSRRLACRVGAVDGVGEDAQAVSIKAHIAIDRLLHHTLNLLGDRFVLNANLGLVALMVASSRVDTVGAADLFLGKSRLSVGFLRSVAPVLHLPGAGGGHGCGDQGSVHLGPARARSIRSM
jgi:hypothetical protein